MGRVRSERDGEDAIAALSLLVVDLLAAGRYRAALSVLDRLEPFCTTAERRRLTADMRARVERQIAATTRAP